ncbi:MAG: T9SS type A sorting domain-containing protein [Saprospiraceae bacterium]|nr:T9SS type A sorting domain-containing protein [Saprospiraceae bacterium]MCB9320221.1 T9SS type A sorting domain-containing protein [Lewinellaceae bacterium]
MIIISFLLLPAISQSQPFKYRGTSPFHLEALNSESSSPIKRPTFKIMFFDLDKDGDLDALHLCIESVDDVEYTTEKNIHFILERQLNVGSPTIPIFGARESFQKPIPVPENSYMLADIGDLNLDGAFDMIVCAQVDLTGNQEILYYQNTGTSLNPSFTITHASTLGLGAFIPGSFFIPDLADLDGDGDLDLLLTGHTRNITEKYDERPVFKYAKNTGTPTSPRFLGWFENPYGLHPIYPYDMYLESGDIDHDNDVDVLSVSFKNNFPMDFYENSPGSNKKPQFVEPYYTLLGIPESGNNNNLLLPALVDLDGDHDLDIVIPRTFGLETFQIEYYENTLTVTERESLENQSLKLYPNPSHSELFITNNSDEIVISCEVIDLQGRTLLTLPGNNKSVPLNKLVNGTYFVRLRTSKGIMYKKFIKS